ncbi:MAG: hypothetical protein HC899_40085 [Leptolyngbyaceae cyanobacterium SM1_4_3]|nr:hypothetical protein [Leptolyngbyaceae cyanobacterium SM1_4_3]
MFFAGFALFSGFQWRNSEINQIGALRASSEALFVSNQKLDALISSLRAGKKLNHPLLQIFPPSPQLRDEVTATLHKVVYQVQERNRLNGGDNANSVGVSFSPHDQRLATAGNDSTVSLWNLQGQMLKEWKAHEDWIWRNSFSPDGQLATVGYDGYVRLWDLQGQLLKELKVSELPLRSVSFSPNSQRVATVGDDDKVCLWNLQNRQLPTKECWEGDGSGTWSVSFSPDGQC